MASKRISLMEGFHSTCMRLSFMYTWAVHCSQFLLEGNEPRNARTRSLTTLVLLLDDLQTSIISRIFWGSNAPTVSKTELSGTEVNVILWTDNGSNLLCQVGCPLMQKFWQSLAQPSRLGRHERHDYIDDWFQYQWYDNGRNKESINNSAIWIIGRAVPQQRNTVSLSVALDSNLVELAISVLFSTSPPVAKQIQELVESFVNRFHQRTADYDTRYVSETERPACRHH